MSGPAFGYSACGRVGLFTNGTLPDGWSDTPPAPPEGGQLDALALTERMEVDPPAIAPPPKKKL